jgi:hypothetical protein
MKSSAFSDIMLRSPLKVGRRFGGICRRHHQCLLAICFMLVSYLAYSSTLKVAETRSYNNHLQIYLQLTYRPKLLFIWWKIQNITMSLMIIISQKMIIIIVTAVETSNLTNYEFLSGLRQINVVPVMREWNYSSTILTLTLDGGECWASRPGSFTLEERVPGVHWMRDLMDCRAGLNAVE